MLKVLMLEAPHRTATGARMPYVAHAVEAFYRLMRYTN